jgi:hypothetical protein
MSRLHCTSREKITQQLLKLLAEAPQGLRYTEVHRKLSDALPEIPSNTIHGTIWNIETKTPEIIKPARGLFLLAKNKEHETTVPPDYEMLKSKVCEEDFYAPFAEYLVKELEECTKAIPVGGNRFKDKWGTPDVVGVMKPRPSDILAFPEEIISGEVKVDDTGLITAFGQACSYKLFSHKSYIAIPESAREEDISRLDSLCMIFGIGLILFDATNPKDPNFQIRTRAIKQDPDMFYVNKVLKDIADELLG